MNEKLVELRKTRAKINRIQRRYRELTEIRDRLALELVDEGATWRQTATAAGFNNPYIAELKRRRDSGQDDAG